jgi:hypothetical protein
MALGSDVSRRHIAILWHERDRKRELAQYAITHLAECWRSDGHAVHFLFGTERYEPADLIIVHVDLSVVPARYLEFAARYPIALNGRVQDIRRTAFSRNLVGRDDGYAGPVIVKSNANHAGAPERTRAGLDPRAFVSRVRRRLGAVVRPQRPEAPPVFGTPLDYRIFERAAEVPPGWFGLPDLVVERFVPERVGDEYAVRNYQFLGDRFTCTRMVAPHPIVNAYTQVRVEPIELDPVVEAWRHQFGFDYGKFDYVVRDGSPVLLDTNKTTGAAGLPFTPELVAARRHRADGLYCYFARALAEQP